MKNEVKKKMHIEWPAMLYQSHSEIDSQEKNINRTGSKVSQAKITTPRRKAQPLARIFILAAKNIEYSARGSVEVHRFRSPRIYNDSCEIFAGA
jgi:hypothetical protein